MELTRHKKNRAEPTEKRSVLATIMFTLLLIGWVGEWPIEIDTFMYSGLWRSPFVVFGPLFAPVPGISLFPWQLMLFALVPFCIGSKTPGSPRQHSREMDRAIIVSLACIAITFAWGMLNGGGAYFAYYQLWRFLMALLITYMLMSVIHSPRDLAALAKVVILAALTHATLCMYFYWAYLYGKVWPLPAYITNHDDSLLFVAAILIATVWAVLKGGKMRRISAAVVVMYLLYAIVLNDRRIAWVEIVLSIPLGYLLLGPGPLRSRVNRWAIIAAPLVAVYIAAGTAIDSPIFAPVKALSSTGSDYDPSSLTRQEEARNLLHTLVDSGNPILGTGWGVPYDLVERYWSNYAAEWILFVYTPHNSLLGVAAFAGLFGIIGIWGVIPIGAYLGARGYRASTDPIPRTAAWVSVGTIAAYSAHCYGDVGLQSFPCNLLFAAALATAGKVVVWSEAAAASRAATAPASDAQSEPAPTGRAAGWFGGRVSPSPWRRTSIPATAVAKPDRLRTRPPRL